MHIQGRKLKSGREPLKGVLNEFSDSRTITFKERETGDVVDVEYQMEENEKGYFSEEYRADTIAREGAKVIDITAFIINEEKGMCRWWLYDVKRDVGGQDVIWHLCEQWQAAYGYLCNSVINYLLNNSIESKGNIGVITHNFDTDRIRAEFALLDETIKEMEKGAKHAMILAKRKGSVRLPILQAKRKLLKNILNRKICFRDAGRDIELEFDVKIPIKRDCDEYYYHLICKNTRC
ncbi:hypothetical protein [Parablautia intestinalis]|uniref:hypothetical protein n=1 Tax=Parablautia intestinalis TaxID=2320100 RepID=UPI00256E9F76|nr:hypothetical protein [Parablautia intestinalis]